MNAVESLVVVARVLLAITFLLAGWGKLRDIEINIITRLGARAIAQTAIPIGEIFLSGLLLLGWEVKLSAVLSASFITTATAYLFTRGRGKTCNCFGSALPTPWRFAITRNAQLLAITLWLMLNTTTGAGDHLFALSIRSPTDIAIASFLLITYAIAIVFLRIGWNIARLSAIMLARERKGNSNE